MSHDDLINEDEARKHLELVHTQAAAALVGLRRPGVLQLVSMAPDDRGLTTECFAIGDIDGMLKAAVDHAQAHRNVFLEARTVRAGRPGERGRGKLESTIKVFGFVVDHDADRGKAGTINGHASVTVQTSPPNNIHQWFFLDRALDVAEAKPLGEVIRKGSGADTCTGVVTGCYRLAGTPNFSGSAKIARGRPDAVPTRLISITDKVWTPDELAAVFQPTRRRRQRLNPLGSPPMR